MAFGNGGAYVGPSGTIMYKPSIGGASSIIKNPTANLYNTVYVKKLSNIATSTASYNSQSEAYISSTDFSTNYDDIIIDVVLGYSEPPPGLTDSTLITQSLIDSSSFVGTTVPTSGVSTANTLVFNEIGLFAGTNNLFIGDSTASIADVNNFVNQSVNFSNVAGTKSKLMLTHVVFHPIQKSANRSLEIIYTLRIQMGSN